jgi:hypothetical protein
MCYGFMSYSQSSLQPYPSLQRTSTAVFGYQDAPYAGSYDPYNNDLHHSELRNAISVVCGRLVVHLRQLVLLASWLLFVLTMIEPPHWCRIFLDSSTSNGSIEEYGDCKAILIATGTTADGKKHQEYYPNSNMMLLTISQSSSIELMCIGFISFYLVLKFADDGFFPSLFFYKGYKRWIHSAQCILIGCLLAGNRIGNTKYNPFFRIFLLGSFLRKFQRELATFLKMVRRIHHSSLGSQISLTDEFTLS